MKAYCLHYELWKFQNRNMRRSSENEFKCRGTKWGYVRLNWWKFEKSYLPS